MLDTGNDDWIPVFTGMTIRIILKSTYSQGLSGTFRLEGKED
jgi:hypothetical protein